jgi:hypothetical protein
MPTRQVSAVISEVLDLSDEGKFQVFDALVEDLGEKVELDDPVTRSVQERNEAVTMIGLVAEHLGLEAREAPTVKQFDEVVGDVAEDWNTGRVIRAWEAWRSAIRSYKNERHAQPLARRQARAMVARGNRKRSRSDYINGVRQWLATEPQKETIKAYSSFAAQHNVRLVKAKKSGSEAALPLVAAFAVQKNLQLGWPLVLKVSKREITLSEAQALVFAERIPPPSEDRIIGLAALARLLKQPEQRAMDLFVKDKNFPTTVAYIQGHRAWLYEDVLLYKRGLATPQRDEGELQVLFADAEEIRARVKMLPGNFQSAFRRQRWDLIPRPEGALVAGIYYWKRTQVNHWLQNLARTWAIGVSLRAGQERGKRRPKPSP